MCVVTSVNFKDITLSERSQTEADPAHGRAAFKKYFDKGKTTGTEKTYMVVQG